MASKRTISPFLLPLVLSGLPLSDARLQTRYNTIGTPAATCQVLYNAFPDLTFFSNETEYTTINEGMRLPPLCIVDLPIKIFQTKITIY